MKVTIHTGTCLQLIEHGDLFLFNLENVMSDVTTTNKINELNEFLKKCLNGASSVPNCMKKEYLNKPSDKTKKCTQYLWSEKSC